MNHDFAGQRYVFLTLRHDDPFDLNVPANQRDWPSGETISAARLRHKIPKEAKRAYDRARKFVNAADHQKAAVELEAAVALDPEFADAHTQLGLEYAKLGRLTEARTSLQRAFEVDPDTWSHPFNLGLVLYLMGDYSAAEGLARKAVQLAGTLPQTQWLLGFLLYNRKETRQEGIVHLEYAARTIPQAKEFLQTMEK
jgi:tetratricopeptide (TPR) repeat protein